MQRDGLIDRAGPVLLGLLAPAVLLGVDPSGWYPFGPVKWLLVTVLGFGGAAAVLTRRPAPVPRSLGRWLLAFLASMALAAAVGLDPVYAWVGTPERHLGVLTWVLCAALLVAGTAVAADRGGRARWTVLGGAVIAGWGVGTVATLEALGWEPSVLDAGPRLTGTFGSAAYLGAVTAALLPLCLGVAADASAPRRLRPLAAVAVLPLGIAAVGSGARAGWVGLVVAAVVVAWVRRPWLREHARAARWAALAGTGLVVGVVLLTPVGSRLAALGDPDAAGGRGRLDEWRVAGRVALDHPVTGVGPEGYRIAFATGVDARYERVHGREQQPDRAHAGPLDVLLAGGLPGLVSWVAVVVLVGRRVVRALRTGPAWLVGLGAGLVAHVVGQLLLFPLAELEPVVWLWAGLLVGTVETGHDGRFGRTVPRPAVAALAALAVVAVVAGLTDMRADRRAEVAAEALARRDVRAAADAATHAVDQRPDVVRLHVLAAAALVAADRGTVAGLDQLDEALAISPGDPIVLLARARLLVERAGATGVPAHREEARAELDRLLREDPHNRALWEASALLAAAEGDDDGARAAEARVAELAPRRR